MVLSGKVTSHVNLLETMDIVMDSMVTDALYNRVENFVRIFVYIFNDLFTTRNIF